MILHDPLFPFDAARVKEIRVFVFNDKGDILCVKKGRRVSIPSGRQEWDDDDFEDAAKREVYEQTTILLEQVIPAAIIEEKSGATLILAGKAQDADPKLGPWPPQASFLDKETFLKRYRFGTPEVLNMVVKMAENAAKNLLPPALSLKQATNTP